MATNWKTIALEDVQAFLSSAVISANGKLNEADQAGNTRVTKLIQMQVDRCRAAILTGGRTPVSLTPNVVPPECVPHVCMLIVEAFVFATPRIGEFVVTEQMGWAIKAARDFIKDIGVSGEALSVTAPTDPDPATLPHYDWGDLQGTNALGTAGAIDMTTKT